MQGASGKPKLISREMFQKYGALVMFVVVFAFNCFFTRGFTNPNVVRNLFIQAMPTVMVGIGMTIVIATGNMNISLGSTMALGAIMFALVMREMDNIPLAILTMLVLGAVAGFIIGILVAKFKVQSMIAAMSGMYVYRGLARVIAKGSTITYVNKAVSEFSYARIGGTIPVQLVITIVLVVLAYLFVVRTRFGVFLEATGDNVRAAYLSGINTVWVIACAYMISGILGSMAGVAKCITVASADGATIGVGYEFNAIASSVVGGTPMSGGKPNIIGTLFAGLLLQTIEIMVNMNNIYFAVAQILKAIIIVIAVYAQYAGMKEN